MRRLLTFMMVPMLALAVGCAKAPTEKLEAAEKAVNDARAAGSADYMAVDFAKVEGMLATAQKEIADQDAKMALLRDYGKAEELLASAKTDAERVTTETAQKKEEAKASAAQAQQAAQEAVKTAQGLVARAPVGKDRAALEAIKHDVIGLQTSLPEVQQAIEAGDYKAAQAKAKSIQDKSEAVSAEIQSALAKTGGAKAQKAQKGKPGGTK